MEQPIRVLQVIGSMNRGGAEAMIMNLYRKMDRSKIQFDFVENNCDPAAFDDEISALGGKIYRCPHYNGKNHFIYKKWWHNFFKEHVQQYRIVHGHLGSTAAIYLKIAKNYGLYTIAHSHSAQSEIRNVRDALYCLYSYPTRFIANHFFACSQIAAESRYGKSVAKDANRCAFLNNAINLSQFQYSPSKRKETRETLGLAEKIVIGHVGRFHEAKNHDFLIRIFHEIHKNDENTVLLLVGDGELRERIKETISSYHLEDCVILSGVQSNVSDYYQAMDVLVFPSFYEGLPVTLVEAQAAGLPCCISDTISEEIAMTDCIHFLSLQDTAEHWAKEALSLAHLADCPDTSEQLTKAGYDIATTAKWLEGFYLEAAKKHE